MPDWLALLFRLASLLPLPRCRQVRSVNPAREMLVDRSTRTEHLASAMLMRRGMAVIWDLHVAAAILSGDGNNSASAAIVKIADAAERECRRQASADRFSAAAP